MDGLMKNMSPIVIFVLSSISDEMRGRQGRGRGKRISRPCSILAEIQQNQSGSKIYILQSKLFGEICWWSFKFRQFEILALYISVICALQMKPRGTLTAINVPGPSQGPKSGRARCTEVDIICPPGWDRVNYSAKI